MGKENGRRKEEVEMNGWKEIMENYPEILFRPVCHSVDVRIKLSSLVTNKGAYEAMRGAGRLLHMYSSSVYVWHTQCLSVGYTESTNPEEKAAVCNSMQWAGNMFLSYNKFNNILRQHVIQLVIAQKHVGQKHIGVFRVKNDLRAGSGLCKQK